MGQKHCIYRKAGNVIKLLIVHIYVSIVFCLCACCIRHGSRCINHPEDLKPGPEASGAPTESATATVQNSPLLSGQLPEYAIEHVLSVVRPGMTYKEVMQVLGPPIHLIGYGPGYLTLIYIDEPPWGVRIRCDPTVSRIEPIEFVREAASSPAAHLDD